MALPEGRNVRLREIRDDDLEHIVRWRNDPQILGMLFSHHPLSMQEQREWFAKLPGDSSRVSFIVEMRDGRAVGQGGFAKIDRHSRNAELGIVIGERELQGRGLGAEAVRLLMSYGFGELNLHRISLRVLGGNARALHVYRKLGFKDEGVLREAIYKNGAFRDIVLLGLLEKERAVS
jgi:UDP-4-amino-4,6-dideoxy-N-acetyl-beta-L-altrosamine N-acetyltransferase